MHSKGQFRDKLFLYKIDLIRRIDFLKLNSNVDVTRVVHEGMLISQMSTS